MVDFLRERIKMGRTDLFAGPLGLGSSYFAPTRAWEAAYDAGCNYFYWGAVRTPGMGRAIRNIIRRGERDKILVVIQAYIRPGGIEWSLHRGLKRLGADYADILLLGWHNKPALDRTLEIAQRLREKGIFRYLGISGHNRSMFAHLADDRRYDVFMLRYNAAHRGAEQDVFPLLPEDRQAIVGFTATRWMQLVKSRKIPEGERRPTPGDCYRFVVTSPFVDVVITGPRTAGQMEENLREVSKGPMTPRELEWMRRVGDSVYGHKTIPFIRSGGSD